ncbi:NADH-quinone oxidoreductase subunit L [Acidihalobacter aeolianus]|uniref:NADH-quinone oxidoreductase subunit L n=1 Tax=Acidihalobacter aeolianus TaxID=2792603 RepID=A0A1D8K8M6_9GAMM|nr:NADH-quinone oxidoreductase subunit L [Acidihalobacter aeolianus]AOV17314.1 NADH-quinone oxidoreductase subunit L [Acidihalobacter aeolianus]
MEAVYLAIPLAPLIGAVIAGLFGRAIGRTASHTVTTGSVALAFVLSLWVFKRLVFDGAPAFDGDVYTWMSAGGYHFSIGFLIDRLSVLMMVVVTFVSLMVHIYTIGYMGHDEELWPEDSHPRETTYQRFFSYISLFTFAMLMLVMANNFLQLFFGWEAVGLVSYLLIGFYTFRESAIYANLKAFLVNRVGDFGFLLGIAAVYMYTGSLNYREVFAQAPSLVHQTMSILPGDPWSVPTVIAILLFIGAMGKSAQVPLHVWLPDSMEGPTPISALIHAATMVTAGIFMVSRMSPIYELSTTALSVVLVIGSLTAFFMGLIGIVQNDIKRVIAYSTLSQLGYMTAALGASAYAAGMFHLVTHAFFKSLLFLAAGSVIMAMHHEQDIRKMGGLRRYMPITYVTSLIGSLALIGFPGFSGFFSKDTIIEAVHEAHLPGATLAYWLLLLGVLVTALYTFRSFFLVFHGQERMDEHTRAHLRESPKVVTIPLILLAIPAFGAGYFIHPILFGDYFRQTIEVLPAHNVLAELGRHYHGALAMIVHGLFTAPFALSMLGVGITAFIYLYRPDLAAVIKERAHAIWRVLDEKYGFDTFNDKVFAGGGRVVGRLLWRVGDAFVIDGLVVNGAAKVIGWTSARVRHIQTGYLYHYSFAMIIGLLVLLSWFVFL